MLLLTRVDAVIRIAVDMGYTLERSRNGRQIDFGNKKLHEGHLRKLYPRILQSRASIHTLVEEVAPGRPCAHKPMREIVEKIRQMLATTAPSGKPHLGFASQLPG
jgi:hypothetical protein